MEALTAAPATRRSRGSSLRTTLILPTNLDRNIEVFCAMKGLSKNAAMLKLISMGLIEEGYRPDEVPELKFRYRRPK